MGWRANIRCNCGSLATCELGYFDFSQLITCHWSLITSWLLRLHHAIISVLVAPHFQHVNHFQSAPMYDCVPQTAQTATN